MLAIKKFFQTILYIADVFLFIVAPLFIIMLIVCVIFFIERYEQHNRFVNVLEAHGQVMDGKLVGSPHSELGYRVEFAAEGGELLYGYLKPRYYAPEVRLQFTAGAQVRVLYVPPAYMDGREVVLADSLDQVRNYVGYAYDIGGIFIVSWLIIALHPEWLYWGFVKNFDDILKHTQVMQKRNVS